MRYQCPYNLLQYLAILPDGDFIVKDLPISLSPGSAKAMHCAGVIKKVGKSKLLTVWRLTDRGSKEREQYMRRKAE